MRVKAIIIVGIILLIASCVKKTLNEYPEPPEPPVPVLGKVVVDIDWNNVQADSMLVKIGDSIQNIILQNQPDTFVLKKGGYNIFAYNTQPNIVMNDSIANFNVANGYMEPVMDTFYCATHNVTVVADSVVNISLVPQRQTRVLVIDFVTNDTIYTIQSLTGEINNIASSFNMYTNTEENTAKLLFTGTSVDASLFGIIGTSQTLTVDVKYWSDTAITRKIVDISSDIQDFNDKSQKYKFLNIILDKY